VNSAGVEVGVVTAGGAVHQLVRHHGCAGPKIGGEAADRTRPEDAPHTEFTQSPHVGAVRHRMRREFVMLAMARQECDLVVADGAMVIGADGGPYGVSITTLRASSSKNV